MKKERGMALLIALWALALVGIFLPVLLAQGRAQIQSARLQEGDAHARALADAAEQLVVRGLTDPLARTQPLFWQAMRGDVVTYGLGDADVRVQIRDLHGCFNVNALGGPDADRALQQLVHLLQNRPGGFAEGGLSPEAFAQRLADWIDSDSQRREQGMEAADALRLSPPALIGNHPLADISEIDLIAPRRAGRFWRYPELCALPETGSWRLNANALGERHLPLLDALFMGRVSRSLLQRLVHARPALGYTNVESLRRIMGGESSEEAFSLMTERLILNSGHYMLGVEVHRDAQAYRYVRALSAAGVSRWDARTPAQRVKLLARQQTTLWEAGDGAAFMLR